MKLYFDGSHTDISSGCGFVLIRNNMTILEASNTISKQNTSNVAEYVAFIEGVSCAARTLDPKEPLEIFGDSQLIINQVLGKYKVKAEHLKKFCELAKKRVEALKQDGHRVTITWIGREHNKQADKLAGKASSTPSRSGPKKGSN
jgi:ribonuclease HI